MEICSSACAAEIATEEPPQEDDEDSTEEEEADHRANDSVCIQCDDGGLILQCDGPCMRSFHTGINTFNDEEKFDPGYCNPLGLRKDIYQALKTSKEPFKADKPRRVWIAHRNPDGSLREDNDVDNSLIYCLRHSLHHNEQSPRHEENLFSDKMLKAWQRRVARKFPDVLTCQKEWLPTEDRPGGGAQATRVQAEQRVRASSIAQQRAQESTTANQTKAETPRPARRKRLIHANGEVATGRAAYGGSNMEPETAARLRAMADSTSEEEEVEHIPLGLRKKQLQRHQQTKARSRQRDRPAQQGQMQAPVRLAAPAGKAPAGSQAAATQAARAARAPMGSGQQHIASAGRAVTDDAGQGAARAGSASKPPLGARASNKPADQAAKRHKAQAREDDPIGVAPAPHARRPRHERDCQAPQPPQSAFTGSAVQKDLVQRFQ
eukprot:jgi/Astpho2/9818/Aster-x1610